MRSERQQRFSFRKYAVGLVSVLVGCLFCGATVLAEEQEVSSMDVELPPQVQEAMDSQKKDAE